MNKKPKKTLEFSPKKVSDTHERIVDILQELKLSIGELLILYGNLGYTLGASIAGYKEKGPSPEELERMYYAKDSSEDPRHQLGVALMLQGMTTTSWQSSWENIQLNEDTKEE
jgi:hypothetical protein